jgi:hypothetical protein
MIKQTLCGIAIVAILLFGSATVYQTKVSHSARLTDAQITQYFEGDNQTYFEGKLPPTEIHFVENLHGLDGEPVLGITYPGNPYRIYLEAKYADELRYSLMTLKHEECHEAVDENLMGLRLEFEMHGPQFQKCMLRLANNGAFKELW